MEVLTMEVMSELAAHFGAPPIEASKLVDGQPDDRRPTLGEIASRGRRYLRTRPLLSLDTVGSQLELAARTIQYFLVDLFTGRFQCQELIRQPYL
jgi:phospholipid/cholesterol/gamma-HCH transport system permease protein